MKNKSEKFGKGDTNETVVGDLLQILRVISTPINLATYIPVCYVHVSNCSKFVQE